MIRGMNFSCLNESHYISRESLLKNAVYIKGDICKEQTNANSCLWSKVYLTSLFENTYNFGSLLLYENVKSIKDSFSIFMAIPFFSRNLFSTRKKVTFPFSRSGFPEITPQIFSQKKCGGVKNIVSLAGDRYGEKLFCISTCKSNLLEDFLEVPVGSYWRSCWKILLEIYVGSRCS